jgi:hypothetical protein
MQKSRTLRPSGGQKAVLFFWEEWRGVLKAFVRLEPRVFKIRHHFESYSALRKPWVYKPEQEDL